ncbi:MAG: carboxypeptidase regulatory-like domain-containing protein [Deltaproteobacteria bacterium]|nr:carboxypeptidase regulatory-like domain-containing protein [Deltaproteobacteria bacterium]
MIHLNQESAQHPRRQRRQRHQQRQRQQPPLNRWLFLFAFAWSSASCGNLDLSGLEGYQGTVHGVGDVSGTVHSEVDDAPVVGAEVRIDGRTTVSDQFGVFRVTEVAAGQQLLIVSASGFSTSSQTIAVATGSNVLEPIVLATKDDEGRADASSGGGADSDGTVVDGGARVDAGTRADSGGSEISDADVSLDGGVVGSDGGNTSDVGGTTSDCRDQTFTFRAPLAQSVWLTGTFTNWATTPAEGALVMTRTGASDATTADWAVTTRIEDSGRHAYRFIIDGQNWAIDEENPDRILDDEGIENSVRVVCTSPCGDPTAFDWRDVVGYSIATDRFYDGELANNDPMPGASEGVAASGPSAQYEGGDLKGIEEKLSYLQDLGVTAILLTSVEDARDTVHPSGDPNDTHMYAPFLGHASYPSATDFGDFANPSPRPIVEPRFGSEIDLRRLVDAAHAANSANHHGIKVLASQALHHVDITSELYAERPSWFIPPESGALKLCTYESLWFDPFWGTRCAFTDFLPPFDFDQTAVRAWLVDRARWWASTFEFDGYYFDGVPHIAPSVFEGLRTAFDGASSSQPSGWSENEFLLLGMTYDFFDRDRIAAPVGPSLLSGQLDVPWMYQACETLLAGDQGIERLTAFMDANDGYYGDRALMITGLGGSDFGRPIHAASQTLTCHRPAGFLSGWTSSFPQPRDAAPYERLETALALFLTTPGLPVIQYGDEVGLAGGGMPDNVRLMPWDDSSLNNHQRTLREHVRKLARIRAENPVVGRGKRVPIAAPQDVMAYRMAGCGDAFPPVVVAINKGDSAETIDVGPWTYTDLMNDNASVAGGNIRIEPRSIRVLRR